MPSSINGLSCNLSTNAFTLSKSYIYGATGELLTEMNANGAWDHSDVYADGRLLATYRDSNTYFEFNDWLGSKRAQLSAAGSLQTYGSLPFGDDLLPGEPSTTTTSDAAEQHFTGKERDAESGLDDFGPRYYASTMGRFMSPDPLMATPMRLLDQQEWNMYAYVRNNPLSITDPTGLDIWLQGCGSNSSTCHGNYVGTTDSDGNFSRTHLTGDQTGSASLGQNGITVTQDGNTYQGVWDRNAGEQGAVLVSGAGDLSSFNAKNSPWRRAPSAHASAVAR